ncbi:MAG: hypothetical protein LCI00_31705 [Chloroflexi bacterium]|nr:hypothetical protein [Chloroflexota bacterium]
MTSDFSFNFPLSTFNYFLAMTAAANPNDGGGLLPYFCRSSAISAPCSLTPAATKCQFGGSTGASRPPFRRIIVQNVQLVQNLPHFLHFVNIWLVYNLPCR